jgi:tight adherence protein C
MLKSEIVLYLSIALTGYAVYLIVSTLLARNRDQEVLSWASGGEPVKSKSPLINFARPLVHQFTIKYAARLKSPERVKKIEKLILTSGLSKELNVEEFIGLQIFWGIAFPMLLGLLNFAYDLGLPSIFLLLVGAFGWWFPEMYAKNQKKAREQAIRVDLPFFADLLALSTEAGLDFVGAIQKIVDKAQGSVLAEELSIVLKDIKLGASRADALRGLALRCDLMEITSFVAVLIDADATGASISKVLKDQSEQIRLERFVRAEKAGAKASQLIMFPIMLFIVPAVFIVVFGPVALNFMFGGGK